MSQKIKTIKLQRHTNFDASEPGKLVYHYKVIQVTDCLTYPVNTFINEEQAQTLCDSELWKVTLA